MGQSLDAQISKLEEIFRSEADPEGRGFVPLADAYRRAGDLDRALDLLSEGLQEHPDYLAGHVVAGWIHVERGDPAAARGAFDRALAIDPRNTEGLRGLASLLASDGEKEEALRLLEALRQEDPTDPELPSRIRELRGEVTPAAGEEEPTGEEGPAEKEEPAEVEEAVTEPTPSAVEPDDGVETAVEEAFHSALLAEEPAVEELPAEESVVGDVPVAEPAAEMAPAEEPIADLVAEEPAAEEAVVAEGEDDGFWVADDGPAIPGPDTLDPAMATRTLGEVYLSKGLFERAEKVFGELLEADPDDAELAELLHKARSREGSWMVEEPAPAGGPDPSAAVPIEDLAPEVVPIEDLAPDAGEVADLEGDAPTPAEELATEVVPIEVLAPDVAPIEALAPEAVPIEDLAPDVVPIEALAPATAVTAPGPEVAAAVPVETLAPEVVPIEALAPDRLPGSTDDGGDGEEGDEDPTLDDFQNWLDKLQ